MHWKPEFMGVRFKYWALALLAVVIGLAGLRLIPSEETLPAPAASIKPADQLRPLAAKPAAVAVSEPADIVKHTAGPEPLPHALLQLFSDPDADVRLHALKQLEPLEIKNNQSLAILTAFLSDSDARIRAHAALRLGSCQMAASEAVPILKQLAFTDPNDLVRSRAKDALYNIRLYDFSPQSF